MTDKEIHHIICAVVGKPTSRTTVTKAINLALEHDARLTFAHVINAEFMAQATPTMTSLRTIYNQLRELGEFSMLILCDRAQRRGVKNADYIIREGEILNQLRLVINEMQPDMFVIGKPLVQNSVVPAIPAQEIADFIADLEERLNIQIVPVEISLDS
jgi:nucleotide-binding universal stress UspA family protein